MKPNGCSMILVLWILFWSIPSVQAGDWVYYEEDCEKSAREQKSQAFEMKGQLVTDGVTVLKMRRLKGRVAGSSGCSSIACYEIESNGKSLPGELVPAPKGQCDLRSSSSH